MLQKKEVAIAAPLPSAERVVTTAASVPISVDGVIAVEEKNTAEGGFGIPLEIVDGKWENVEEAAPTYCCTAVDHYEQIELVVEEVAVDEGGKSTSTSTILEVENVCQGRGLVWDCCFWLLLYVYWVVLVCCNQTGARLLDVRLLDEALRRTDITLALSRKVVSYSAILRLQGIYGLEHVSVGGDKHPYQIPAVKACGWEVFSCTAMKKSTEAVELYWLAATALGMSVRKWSAEARESGLQELEDIAFR